MKKKVNKGFSIIEVIIALAIFAVFMIPIVSTTISSLRQSTGAKELQSRDDFAKAVMEYVKGETVDNIMSGDYLRDELGANSLSTAIINGSEELKDSTDDTKTLLDAEGNPITYTYNQIAGRIQLGNKDALYDFYIQLDNEYYVRKGLETGKNGKKFVDPNTLTLGIVEDLDTNKVAMVDGTFSNFDTSAEEDFLVKKIEWLMVNDSTKYNQYMQQKDNSIFRQENATGTRTVTVKIEPSGSKYLVSCTLDYWDNSKYLYDTDRHIQRGFYGKEFDDITNIYLMYNPFFYNGGYSKNDYIVIDRSAIPEDEEVNVFIIETAKNASEDILKATASTEKSTENSTQASNQILYRNDIENGSKREDVKIHIVAARDTGKSSVASAVLKNLNVYHNFGSTVTNEFYYYKATDVDVNTTMESNYQSVYSNIQWEPLWAGDTYDATVDAKVAGLGEAGNEKRNLYNVKIWIEEAEDTKSTPYIDIKHVEPILEGTMGGSES